MRDPKFIGGNLGNVEADIAAPVTRFDYKTRARSARRNSARRTEKPEPKIEGDSRTVFDDLQEKENGSRVLAPSQNDSQIKNDSLEVENTKSDENLIAPIESEDDALQFRFGADGQIELLPITRRKTAPSVPIETAPASGAVERVKERKVAGGVGAIAHMAMLFSPISSFVYDLQMQFGGGVRVERQRVQLHDYPRGAAPLRIAFLSDLHYGPTSGRVAARQAWQRAKEANPDVLLLGGDFVYADERGLPTLFRELQRWKNAMPNCRVFACLGNHDHLADIESLITGMEACGVRVLVNEAQELPSPWQGVYIVGADDSRFGDPQLELALSTVPRGACAIMLAHSPEVCEDGALKRCSLTLCGDTHGGQICLPNGDAPFMPKKWGRQYTAGLHRHAGNYVFVSRGVGVVGVPLRLFSPPDIALLEVCGGLRGASRAAANIRANAQCESESATPQNASRAMTAPGGGHVKIIANEKSAPPENN